MPEISTSRFLRRTQNSKQDKIETVKTRPSLSSLREGQEVLFIDKRGVLGRYRRENSRLWVNYMTTNGNQVIDRDLHIKGSLVVDGDSNITGGGGSGDITGVDLTQGTGIAITDELNTTSGDYSATISCDLEGEELKSTGEGGTTKFLRTDSDGTCSWQVPSYYTHPTDAGNKHIPADGSSGEFLKYDSSGTAVWATPSYIANTDTMGDGFTVAATTTGTGTTITEGDSLTLTAGTGITTTGTSDGVVTIACTVTDTNTNQLTTFTLQADGGGAGTVQQGSTVDIAGGTNCSTAYSANTVTINATDTNTNKLTTWELRDDDDDAFTIADGNFLKVVAATGTLGTNIAGSGTTGDPWVLTITSPDTTTNTNQLTTWELRDDDSDTTISQSKYLKVAAATGALGSQVTGAGTDGNPYILTITSPDTTYSAFTGDSGSGGVIGLVPAPGSGDAAAGKYLDSDGSWTVPSGIGVATSSALGTIKIEDDTEQAVAANAVSATAGKTYGVQLNSSDQAVVNVPWTDNNTMGSGFILAATTDTNSAGTIIQNDTLTFGAGDGIKCETTGSDTVTTSLRNDIATSLGDIELKGQVASTDYAKISVKDTGATTAGTGLKIYAGGPATSSNTNLGTEECTLTDGSLNVTPGTAEISFLAVGQLVTGTGIPANTRVVSLGSTTSFNINKLATVDGAEDLTFYSTNIVDGGDLDFYSGVTQGSGTSKMTFNISTGDEDGTTAEALVLEEDPTILLDGYKTLRPSIDASTAGACSLGTADEAFEKLHVKDIYLTGEMKYQTDNTLFTVSGESGSDNLSGGGTLQFIGGADVQCVVSEVSGTTTKVAIDLPANIGHTGNMTSIILSDLLTAKNIYGVAGQNMIIKNQNTTDAHGKLLTIAGGGVTDTGSGNYNSGSVVISSGDGHGTGTGWVYLKAKKSGTDAAALVVGAGPDPSDSTELSFMPVYDSQVSLGSTSYRWSNFFTDTIVCEGDIGSSSARVDTIYADNALNTSDARLKKDIEPTFGLEFINKLNPISYKWKDRPEKRHHGLIAQEIRDILDREEEFAGYDYDEAVDEYNLGYTEFIAPLIKAVQELSARVEELENG